MSRSEKLRYILARPPRFDVSVYVPALEEILGALPDKGHLTTLKEYAVNDDALLYKMVARFVPLSYHDAVELINGFVQQEKNGEDIITEEGETEVANLTNVLMVRAGGLREMDDFVAAAELVFAVIMAVEPEIPHVYDEGWTYQCILNDAFEFMTDMVEKVKDGFAIKQLHEMVLNHFESRRSEDCYYDSQFEELLEAIRIRL